MHKTILCFLVLATASFHVKAQNDTFSTINFPNSYTNTITTGLYISNPRSGFIYQSNGSINYGLTGQKASGFKFRWLAHDSGAIDYSTDTDQVMFLDGNGNLNIKGGLTANGSTINLPNSYNNTITTRLYAANFRSGLVHQSNGSINFGLTGAKSSHFKFRWLAHDNGTIDYSTDSDQLMYLDEDGNLNITGSLIANGNIGIGTADTKGYKLAVAGNMIAEKVKVKLQSGWPDYIFGEDYVLPSLTVVEKYINEHKHLPGIPTAAAVEKDGLDVGEMNKQLLQKVEELTLYIIKLKKDSEAQRQMIQELQESINK